MAYRQAVQQHMASSGPGMEPGKRQADHWTTKEALKFFIEFFTIFAPVLWCFFFPGHKAHRILAPDQGSNTHSLRWKAKITQPLDCQGSPNYLILLNALVFILF